MIRSIEVENENKYKQQWKLDDAHDKVHIWWIFSRKSQFNHNDPLSLFNFFIRHHTLTLSLSNLSSVSYSLLIIGYFFSLQPCQFFMNLFFFLHIASAVLELAQNKTHVSFNYTVRVWGARVKISQKPISNEFRICISFKLTTMAFPTTLKHFLETRDEISRFIYFN